MGTEQVERNRGVAEALERVAEQDRLARRCVLPVAPVAAAVTSTGLAASIPLNSRMRMSGNAAATLNCTVTVLVFAAAA